MEDFISTIKEHKIKFVLMLLVPVMLVLIAGLYFKANESMSTVADLQSPQRDKTSKRDFFYPIKKFVMLVQDNPDDFT